MIMVNTIFISEDIDSNYLLVNAILVNSYNLIRALTSKEAVELENQ